MVSTSGSLNLHIHGHRRYLDNIYWADSTNNKLERGRIDGNERETIKTSYSSKGICLYADKLYSTLNSTNTIQEMNRDGSSAIDIITSDIDNPYDIEYFGGKLYWCDYGLNRVTRANRDGTDIEIIVSSGLGNPFGLAIHRALRKIYITDSANDAVYRCDLNGDNFEEIISGLNIPRGIDIDYVDNKLIIANDADHEIIQSDLDGSNVETLLSVTLPLAIEVDSFSHTLYFSYGNNLNHKIAKYDLSNSEVINIYDQVVRVEDIELGHTLDINLFIHGHDDITTSGNLFIHGHDETGPSGSLFINGHSIIEESNDLYTRGCGVITASSELFIYGKDSSNISGNLFIEGYTTISGYIELFFFVEGGGLSMNDNVSLIVNGYEPKPALACPILDPTASIQITDELIGIYQSRIDALVNQLGKNVYLEFDPILDPCPNCEYDVQSKRSTGIYIVGGPRPFKRGRKCPFCKGRGLTETAVNKCIKCLTKWNPKNAENFGISIASRKGVVRLKTYLTEADDLMRAKTAIVNHDIASQLKLRVKLIRGPIPVGLREDRYCISFWELL